MEVEVAHRGVGQVLFGCLLDFLLQNFHEVGPENPSRKRGHIDVESSSFSFMFITNIILDYV